jgi:hypothetical protein
VALQRRGYAQERIGARVVELGFAAVEAYLVDRLLERTGRWPMSLRSLAHRETVRRRTRLVGVQRRRRTAQQVAAGQRATRSSGVLAGQADGAAGAHGGGRGGHGVAGRGQPDRERAAQRIGRALDGVIRAAQPLIR